MGGSQRSAKVASVVGESDEGDVSDVGSTAPWSVRDDDNVRVQLDQLNLARAFVDTQAGSGVASAEGYSSDELGSSPSSADSRNQLERERKAAAVSELAEVAERVSRVSAMQMASRFRKGRVARGGTRVGEEVRQKVFGLEGSEVLTELDEAGGLYTKLMRGESVMTQYIARTGIGKTTRFASLIAKKCALRVLLLEPDVLLAKAAADAQRDKTRVRTSWSRVRTEHLTTMTYDDFCGQFQSKNGRLMLEQFDVIVMDEAHVPKAEVYVAKALVATYASGNVSLLVLSATLEGEDSQAINNSSVTKEVGGVLVDAVEAGKLTQGARCRDRTMLILPTDEEAARCHQYITEAGHVSYILDSASRTVDCGTVRQALSASSVVKRFLVVTEKFGTGHNFPVSQVYTDATRRVYRMDESTRKVEGYIQPVTVSEVKQHAARVGRGMVQGASSYVFKGRGEAVPDQELMDTERIRAFLLLRAAGVVPLAVLKPPPGFFPFGVTPEVAADVLAVGLPCELAVRYFNRDGRMSANFVRAVRPFAYLQHSFVTSPLPAPIGYDDWEEVPLGGYYGAEVHEGVALRVPFDVKDDELRVKVLAISAAAVGRMTVPDWMPQLSESETSGDESTVVGNRPGRFVPRLVVHEPKPLPPPPQQQPWGFDAEIEGQVGYRASRQGVVAADTYTQATLEFLQKLDHDRVVELPVIASSEMTDRRGVDRVNVLSVTSPSPIDVQTPGGTVVVSLRKDVWSEMSQGVALSPDKMSSLLRAVRSNIAGFVRSSAFANWSNVWLSILRTCADAEVLSYVQHRGSIHVISALLQAMYIRYSNGVNNVTQSSYVKAKFWSRVMRGRSVEQQLESDRSKGKVEIIQSEAFFRRLAEIRASTAKAVVRLEEFGVFAPQTTTAMQHVMPITAMVGDDMIDSVTDVTRGMVRKRLNKVRAPETIGSGSSSIVRKRDRI